MKTKLALIIISVILVGSLTLNSYLYAMQQDRLASDNDLKKQAENLQNQLAILNNQIDSLQNETTNLKTQIANLEKQTENLLNQKDNLQIENSRIQDEKIAIQNQIEQIQLTGEPKIVTRLGTTDVRSTPAAGHPWSGVIRFYTAGEVWNLGTGSARDCRLHITLFQGDTVANDTYIELGTIKAGTYVNVATNIYYTGEALTNWTIIPQYN